jgi:hypothetical protein
MSRAVSDDHGSSVSLFPFLAVLLCTMGALIVLLVLLARQARLHGAQPAAPPRGETASIDAERLLKTRAQLTEQFERASMRLSHLEDRIRRLRDEKASILSLVRQLVQAEQETLEQQQRSEQEQRRLAQLVEESRRQLDERRQELEGRRPSYAVVPFEGNRPTARRPIYIECREDAVVLQPEGVALTADDFRGPLGPGNPLASALRAARQYCIDQSAGAADGRSAEQREPYPLVLVRPRGIVAFYKVREAIESWGPDFGYELVEEDWELEFPPPDPQLANVEHLAIEEARLRARQLAVAAPSRFAAARRYRLQASRGNGGFEAVEMVDASRFGDRFSDRDSSPQHRKDDSGGGRHDADPARSTSSQARSKGLHGSVQGEAQPRGAAPDGGPAESRFDDPSGGTSDDAAGHTSDRDEGASRGETRASKRSAGGSVGQAPGVEPARKTGGGLARSPASTGTNSAAGSALGTSGAVGSIAHARGAGWAMQGRQSGSVPITRPIGIEVRADRLAILREKGAKTVGARDKSVTIPVGDSMVEAVDKLVSGVWQQVDTWGIAGRGLHWKPVLYLSVAPDANDRAAELKRLLQESGLELIEQGRRP